MAARSRLFVPKTVSFSFGSKRGYQPWGTKAFAEQGARMPRGLPKEGKAEYLQRLANLSSHYIKRVSPRARAIRKMLSRAGIGVEKELMDLKNGTSLFERRGFALNSPEGRKIFFGRRINFFIGICEAVAGMHGLGITHNHFHAGNIAVTKRGKVILLDLGRASLFKFVKSGREKAQERLKSELLVVSSSLADAHAIAKLEDSGAVLTLGVAREIAYAFRDAIIARYPARLREFLGPDGMADLSARNY